MPKSEDGSVSYIQWNKCWERGSQEVCGNRMGNSLRWMQVGGVVCARVQGPQKGHLPCCTARGPTALLDPFGQRGWQIVPNNWVTPQIPRHGLNTRQALSVEIRGRVRQRKGEITNDTSRQCESCFLLKMQAVVFWYFPHVTKFMSLISQSSQKGNWWYMWAVWLLWETIQLCLLTWFNPKS